MDDQEVQTHVHRMNWERSHGDDVHSVSLSVPGAVWIHGHHIAKVPLPKHFKDVVHTHKKHFYTKRRVKHNNKTVEVETHLDGISVERMADGSYRWYAMANHYINGQFAGFGEDHLLTLPPDHHEAHSKYVADLIDRSNIDITHTQDSPQFHEHGKSDILVE